MIMIIHEKVVDVGGGFFDQPTDALVPPGPVVQVIDWEPVRQEDVALAAGPLLAQYPVTAINQWHRKVARRVVAQRER